VDKKTRSAATSYLASLGVCFGVMALIVIMSVMNGFQMGYIDSIMEISSYHVQAQNFSDADSAEFLEWCKKNREVISAVPFFEAQAIMVSAANGLQDSAIVRAVPADVMQTDEGFARELKIPAGKFDLASEDSIVLGDRLARSLKVRVGSKVNLLALSGSSSSALVSSNRIFLVKGIFHCEYSDINSSYAFVSFAAGEKNFGSDAAKKIGVKIRSENKDARFVKDAGEKFPRTNFVSWREYNRTFFGVLRMEKNILFLLVFLIFIVVYINIFNSMRKVVFEKKEDAAVLSALGAAKKEVQAIFVFQGISIGVWGAVPGLILGIFLSRNIRAFFLLVSKIQFAAKWIFAAILHPGAQNLVTENIMFLVYSRIPARIFPGETVLIFLFGIFSSVAATFFASRNILKMTVSEILRNE
jgi:lipoprotein-releasing system permease protein